MSAITQRWLSSIDTPWTPSYEQFARDLSTKRRQRIEVADVGTAGTVNTIIHSLGRVPVGVLIINQVTGTGAVNWYRETADAEWTDSAISLRFDNNNARVLLEVF